MSTLAADLFLLLAVYGLAVPVNFAGMPMLGQSAFMSFGAFGTVLLLHARAPLGFAVLGAVAAATVAGYLAGFGAARLSAGFVALSTWTLGWLAYEILLNFPAVSGGSDGMVEPSPAVLKSPALGAALTLGPANLALIGGGLCLLAALGLRRVATGPGGLDLAGLRAGPFVADSLGIPVTRRRRSVLAFSAALGALAGAGGGLVAGVVSAGDYTPQLSIELFVAALIGGTARWWGPLIGGGLLAALPTISGHLAGLAGADPARTNGVVVAALLVLALVGRGLVDRRLDMVGFRVSGPSPAPPAGAPLEPSGGPPGAEVLSGRGIRLQYGGLRVLDSVDLAVRAGEVHALVGPNGSGKTTLLRIFAGALLPTAGQVRIGGVPAAPTRTQAARVALGVARTFQRTHLLTGLDVATQVAVGARGGSRTRLAVLRHLLGTPRASAELLQRRRVVTEVLARVGLGESTTATNNGEQRVLQLARSIATGARVLLLDEPAAGLSAPERGSLAVVIRRLAEEGFAVLLVEHDVGLVRTVADRVSVLADGRVVAEGTPEAVLADALARASYFGEVEESG